MRIFVFHLSLFLLLSISAFSQDIRYELSMPEPHTHYYEVSMTFEKAKGPIDVYIPNWTPGSYKIRDFAKNLADISASFGEKETEILKTEKNIWRITEPSAGSIRINYRVYAFENSVRTSFLDDSHGYINGASVFMVPAGMESAAIMLDIKPFESWSKVSTGLEKQGEFSFKANDYHTLIDSPIEIGNHEQHFFEMEGIAFEVAIYGTTEGIHEEWVEGIKKIVKATHEIMPDLDLDRYVFIIHSLTQGTGGLEHMNSTLLQYSRWTYQNPSSFFSLVAHEYFHLWNAKRIKPTDLASFDYQKENYTTLLWFAEGVTSYYENLILLKAGFFDISTYLNKTMSTLNYVESQPGVKEQSLAESSFDSWIKFYQPNENSVNTTVSYYSKGKIIALLLDIEIIRATSGEKSLDDVLELLYKEYYLKKNIGYSEESLIAACEKVAGQDMKLFFDSYIYGTRTPDYPSFFGAVGIPALVEENKRAELGASTRTDNGKTVISRVLRGSSAYESGLNVNDEIIAVNGFRLQKNELKSVMSTKYVGDTIQVLISRDGIIREMDVVLRESNTLKTSIFPPGDIKKEKRVNFRTWIRDNDES